MSDQLPMFAPMNCEDTPSATSSPESGSGPMPCASPGGPTTGKSGPAPAPANLSARPAKARRSTTKGIYGQSSFDSSKHDDLSFALASRLRPLTDLAGSTLFSLTWTVRVTPAGRSICALRASEPRTEGSVCIGWPTPQVNDDNNSRRSPESMERWLKRDKHSSELGAVASLTAWGTPAARDWKSGEASQETLDKNARPLSEQAVLAGWPTPVANDDNKTPEAHLAMKLRMGERDGSGSNRTAITSLQVMAQLAGWKTPCVPNGGRISGNQADIGKHQDGTKAQIGLENEVRLGAWPTPMAGTPAQKGYNEAGNTDSGRKTVEMCQWPVDLSTDSGAKPIGYLLGPNGWEIRPASGQLNPNHSAWLMGLPASWDEAGIAAFRSLKKRKRGSQDSAATETA